MATATFIKRMTDGFNGDARLFKLDPPMKNYEDEDVDFVIVSAVHTYSGPETYIFAADEDGAILSWSELDGSFQGGLNHDLALGGAGYEVAVAAHPDDVPEGI